ncbi:MAG: M23 family metallopeptidase [Deltaproteobacteria bacterium]|nr:M23 family metallopeptidase [Deltaproteobacteria bacterium]
MHLSDRRRRRHSIAPISLALALLVIAALAAGGLVTFRSGRPPSLEVEPSLPAIGKHTVFKVFASEPRRGLTGLRVELVQGALTKTLVERTYLPLPPWMLFTAPPSGSEVLDVAVGRDVVPQLKSGEATLRVTALGAGTWLLRAPASEQVKTMPVRLTPPSLELKSQFVYVAQGGSEAVVYRVGGTSVKDGVRAGEYWFPGYALPGGGEGDRFAFFAVPYDLADASEVRLVATDDVGNEAAMPFIAQFTPRPFANDTIEVTDRFMEAVVPRIMASAPELEDKGSLLENYLQINGALRRKNSEVLTALAEKSKPAFLWHSVFQRMAAKRVSAFADRRTYVYGGKEVDRQDHLGFDLASTQQANIPAANSGVVALAGYLGIYGNTVVIDHGYGLMTLYGHMSSIAVKEGEEVARGQVIGQTGATGLALGDHLHFSVLLHGLPVTPLEWWDDHWIADRIALKLGAALGYEAL